MIQTASALIACNFVSFFLSGVLFFRRDPKQDRKRFLLLALVSLAFWVVSGYRLLQDFDAAAGARAPVTIAIQALCLAFFWTHATRVKSQGFTVIYSPDVPREIYQRGVYRWVRHPFYTAYILCYFSTALQVGHWATWALFSVIGVAYAHAATLEERKLLGSRVGAQYREYRARTAMFVPFVY